MTVYFVDPRAAFTGHSECDKDAWINHVYGGEPQVSYHADEAGWSEDAQLIVKLLWRSAGSRLRPGSLTRPAHYVARLCPDFSSGG